MANRYRLMTSKVVDEVAGRSLVHFPARKEEYFEKDEFGAVSYFGSYRTNRSARASWRGYLRARGVDA